MRKLFVLFVGCLLFPLLTFGQSIVASQSYIGLNSVAAQTGIDLRNSIIDVQRIQWSPVGTVTTCTVAVDTSADNISWTAGGAIAGRACTSAGQFAVSSVVANFVRVNVTAFTGAGSININYIASVSGSVNSGTPGSIGVQSTALLATVATEFSGSGGTLYSSLPGSNGAAGPLFVGTFGPDPCQASSMLKTTLFQANIVATTQQIAPGVASQKVRICSIVIERNDTTGVATTLKLVEGTGSNCATGQTSLTGNLFTSGATAVTTDSPPVNILGSFVANTTADAVCVQTTGAASSFDVTVSEVTI